MVTTSGIFRPTIGCGDNVRSSRKLTFVDLGEITAPSTKSVQPGSFYFRNGCAPFARQHPIRASYGLSSHNQGHYLTWRGFAQTVSACPRHPKAKPGNAGGITSMNGFGYGGLRRAQRTINTGRPRVIFIRLRRMGRGGSRNPSHPCQTTDHDETECSPNRTLIFSRTWLQS